MPPPRFINDTAKLDPNRRIRTEGKAEAVPVPRKPKEWRIVSGQKVKLSESQYADALREWEKDKETYDASVALQQQQEAEEKRQEEGHAAYFDDKDQQEDEDYEGSDADEMTEEERLRAEHEEVEMKKELDERDEEDEEAKRRELDNLLAAEEQEEADAEVQRLQEQIALALPLLPARPPPPTRRLMSIAQREEHTAVALERQDPIIEDPVEAQRYERMQQLRSDARDKEDDTMKKIREFREQKAIRANRPSVSVFAPTRQVDAQIASALRDNEEDEQEQDETTVPLLEDPQHATFSDYPSAVSKTPPRPMRQSVLDGFMMPVRQNPAPSVYEGSSERKWKKGSTFKFARATMCLVDVKPGRPCATEGAWILCNDAEHILQANSGKLTRKHWVTCRHTETQQTEFFFVVQQPGGEQSPFWLDPDTAQSVDSKDSGYRALVNRALRLNNTESGMGGGLILSPAVFEMEKQKLKKTKGKPAVAPAPAASSGPPPPPATLPLSARLSSVKEPFVFNTPLADSVRNTFRAGVGEWIKTTDVEVIQRDLASVMRFFVPYRNNAQEDDLAVYLRAMEDLKKNERLLYVLRATGLLLTFLDPELRGMTQRRLDSVRVKKRKAEEPVAKKKKKKPAKKKQAKPRSSSDESDSDSD
jgi:chemotaxis protein histidine kinase CheA